MRSLLAGLRTLVLPWGSGPGTARIVLGPDLPPPLDTYLFAGTTVASAGMIYWSATASNDDYQFWALVQFPGQHVIYQGAVLNGAIIEASAGFPAGQSWDFSGAGIVGSTYRGGDLTIGTAGRLAVTTGELNIGPSSTMDVDSGLTYLVDGAAPELSYTPALTATVTNPTLGTGSQVDGRYWRDPLTGWVTGHAVVQFGTAGVAAGSGSYRITMPTDVSGFFSGSTGQADIWGTWSARDNTNTAASRHGLITRDTIGISNALANLALYDGTNPFVTNAVPWAWAASDAITCYFHYLSA